MDKPQLTATEGRMKRRELWLRLWLVRVLSYLSHFENLPPAWRGWADRTLDLLARYALSIVVIRAAQRRKPAASPMRPDVRQIVRAGHRQIRGGALRRACKHTDIRMRVRKIQRLLENLDAHVKAQLRRLRRGLSRHLSMFTRVAPPQAPLPAMRCGALFGLAKRGEELGVADTS